MLHVSTHTHTPAQLEKKARRLGQSGKGEVGSGGGGLGGVLPCRHRRGPESDTPDWASPAERSSEAEGTTKGEMHKSLRVETFRGHFAPHRDCLSAILDLGSLGAQIPPPPRSQSLLTDVSVTQLRPILTGSILYPHSISNPPSLSVPSIIPRH